MKTDPRRFAPLGLGLSVLAALSFLGFLIVKGLAAAEIFTPPDPKLLNQGMSVSALTIILGLAITALLDPERARKFLVGRQMRYGSNSLITLVAFIGVLLFANIIAHQYAQTHAPWDLTEGQKNTLAPETLDILNKLPQTVSARAYYTTSNRSSEITNLLDSLKVNSNDKFTYEYIDPVQNPVPAQNDGIDTDGTVILQMGAQKELVQYASEEELVSAMLRLINPEKRVIYFTTGHGEADTENQSDTSYTLIKRALQNKNYTFNLLSLGSEGKVPADAKVVIIAGPQTAFTTEEVAMLETYLAGGGALIVMEEPRYLTKYAETANPLDDLLAKWGLTLDNDIIIDPNANPPLLVYADPQNYGDHPITAKLRGLDSRFFTASSIKIGTPAQEIQVTPLAQTLTGAWGETDIKSIEDNQVSDDPATDLAGPLILAAAAEDYSTQARLVFFGDVEFAADTLYKAGNGDMLINAVDWAAQQENMISLTPKDTTTRSFNPPGTFELVSIIVTSVCLIPLLVIVAGISAWLSRRHRG